MKLQILVLCILIIIISFQTAHVTSHNSKWFQIISVIQGYKFSVISSKMVKFYFDNKLSIWWENLGKYQWWNVNIWTKCLNACINLCEHFESKMYLRVYTFLALFVGSSLMTVHTHRLIKQEMQTSYHCWKTRLSNIHYTHFPGLSKYPNSHSVMSHFIIVNPPKKKTSFCIHNWIDMNIWCLENVNKDFRIRKYRFFHLLNLLMSIMLVENFRWIFNFLNFALGYFLMCFSFNFTVRLFSDICQYLSCWKVKLIKNQKKKHRKKVFLSLCHLIRFNDSCKINKRETTASSVNWEREI